MRALFLVALVTSSGVAASAPQVPNLVARWQLDEQGGTTVADSSGNGHDGTLVGGVTLAQPGASACTGAAADLDHVAQARIDVPDGPGLTQLRSDLTVLAWVFPESDGTGNQRMRIFGNDGSWSCARYATGIMFTTRTILDYFQPASVPLNSWTHVAFVFDSSYDVTFYVNGVAVGMVAGSSPSNAPLATWYVGTLNTLIEYWDGRLDDIQVYDRSLTPAEILALAKSPGSTLGDAPSTYCTAKTGLHCGVPQISFQGCAAPAAQGALFELVALPARGQRHAMVLYSDNGPATIPFNGGTLCVNPALSRTIAVSSGGTAGGCDGVFRIDMNAFAQGQLGGLPAAFLSVPGTLVGAQWWGRDSVATGSFLSDAVRFTVR